MKRFANHTEDEIMEKRQKAIAKNTNKSNNVAANTFRCYLQETGRNDQFEQLDEPSLARALKHFYCDTRTKKGELYKLTSFENMRHGINRYLKSPPHVKQFDIITGEAFREANDSFKAMLVEIKAAGKGAVDHHPMISDHDLVKLYHSVHMTPNTPFGLLNRVQMNIRLYFCRRANENMETMTKDTFKVASYPDGTKYVYKHADELTKNHRTDNELVSGHMPSDQLQDNDLCPVTTFEMYISKLNPKSNRLWQYPRDSFEGSDQIWYQNRPMGRDTLGTFMTRLSKDVKLSQNYTNHSVRVTGASILSRQNFSPAQIMAVTGHKSVSSLAAYHRVGPQEKQAMGSVISHSIKYGQPTPAIAGPVNRPPLRALPSTQQQSTSCRDLATCTPVITAPVHRSLPASSPKIQRPSTSCQEIVPISPVDDLLDGITEVDLFSEFDDLPLQPMPRVVNVQQNTRAPMFHGCQITGLTINVYNSK